MTQAYDGPAYGNYGPYTNPFGTGFYQGWISGVEVTNRQALERYPDFTSDQLTLYQNGRQDGARRDTTRMVSLR